MDGDFNLDTTNREAIVGSVTPSGCNTHLLGGSKWRSPRPGLTEHLLPGPSVFTAALPGSTSKGPSCSLSPLLRRPAVKAAGRGRLLPELSVFTDALVRLGERWIDLLPLFFAGASLLAGVVSSMLLGPARQALDCHLAWVWQFRQGLQDCISYGEGGLHKQTPRPEPRPPTAWQPASLKERCC